MEGLSHFLLENRPWGDFERFTLNEKSTVKLVIVKPGEAISLQTHEHRDEFWRILSGGGTITVGETQEAGAPAQTFFVPRRTKHRIEAGPEGICVLEISFGDFNEEDIKRLEDRYQRA